MDSKNDKNDGIFAGVFAIICAITATIVFHAKVSGMFGVITIAFDALVGVICFYAVFFIVYLIQLIVHSIVGFIRNKIELNRERNEQRRAIKEIKRAIKIETKNIAADIEKLNSLRKQLTVDDRAVIANYSLCMLLGSLVENESSLMKCSLYCADKYQILLNIREIEKRIELLAKQYEAIGDDTNAELYFSKIR